MIETSVNQAGTAVAAEFLCRLRQPSCTLRIINRFLVGAAGLIVAQENFFDPRDLTRPG